MEVPTELVRLVVGPDGEVVMDVGSGSTGRGAWVHPRPECLQKAGTGALARSLRTQVRTSPTELTRVLRAAALRRIRGLVSAARRAGYLEAGATAVEHAVQGGRVALVLVATDARASAELPWVAPLIAEDRARALATKAELGAWVSRSDTALLAITEARLAHEVRKAIDWTLLPEPNATVSGTRRTVSTEAV